MKKSIQGLYLCALSILGTLAVTLRSVALLTGFNFSSGYFDKKLINAISIVIAATAVVLFATFLIYKKDYKPRVAIGTSRDFASSACVGVALIITAFEIAASAKSHVPAPTFNIGHAVTVIAAALAALSVIYFLLAVLFKGGAPRACAVFSIALMIFLVFYALMLYFDNTNPLNAPVKICDQLAYASLAIFFVYETRISLGRPLLKAYVVSGLTAALLSAYSAIPSLIVYFANGNVISHTISESVLTLALFAFVLIRTISALTAEDDRENSIVAIVKKMHDDRVKEIEDAKLARVQYNNEEIGEDEDENYKIELPSATDDGAERTEQE